MIVSTGLTVPVAVTVREIGPRANGAVTYCTVLLRLSYHNNAPIPPNTKSATIAPANQYFLAP
jgi:hypothetical protein